MIICSRNKLGKVGKGGLDACESMKFLYVGPKPMANQLTLSWSETGFCIPTSSSQMPLNIFGNLNRRNVFLRVV